MFMYIISVFGLMNYTANCMGDATSVRQRQKSRQSCCWMRNDGNDDDDGIDGNDDERQR